MAQFDVETYTVSVATSTGDTAQPRLVMTSPDLTHGIRHRLTILFESTPKTFRDEKAVGYATNVGGANYDGINVLCWMSPSMFDEVYDMVRNESPIKVVFSHKDLPKAPTSTTKFVRHLRVGTDDEVPGEGGADADADSLFVAELAAAGPGA